MGINLRGIQDIEIQLKNTANYALPVIADYARLRRQRLR